MASAAGAANNGKIWTSSRPRQLCYLWLGILILLICLSLQSVSGIQVDDPRMDEDESPGRQIFPFSQLDFSPAYIPRGSISVSAGQKITPVRYVPVRVPQNFDANRGRRNSGGPSLSIVNPLDVLRQRLLLEIGRRRLISQSQQINANSEYLKSIGKRRRR